MRNTSSTGLFISAAIFLVVALMWFLWQKNIAIGIVWMIASVFDLIIAILQRRKEREQ